MRLIINNVEIRSVTVTRVEFKPFKGALYSGTIVDDIHIAYIFADILYLVLIHKIQNKVISRIELFKA